MRDQIRDLVVKAVADSNELSNVIDGILELVGQHELVGKSFVDSYEGRTITSRQATVSEVWQIVYVKDDNVLAELKSTNASMYSGSGYFKKWDIEKVKNKIK